MALSTVTEPVTAKAGVPAGLRSVKSTYATIPKAVAAVDSRHCLSNMAFGRWFAKIGSRCVSTACPASWKTLPVQTPATYLRGFVPGWFAADGHVDPRAPVALLSCARREPLEWLQHIAARAGLAVSTSDRLRRSQSTFGPSQWYSLGISASTLDPEFFLFPEKRARYRAARFVKQWKVGCGAGNDRC